MHASIFWLVGSSPMMAVAVVGGCPCRGDVRHGTSFPGRGRQSGGKLEPLWSVWVAGPQSVVWGHSGAGYLLGTCWGETLLISLTFPLLWKLSKYGHICPETLEIIWL